MIMRIVRHENDVDEVEQELWMTVWRKLFQFRGDSPISTWLYITTKNVSLMFLRRKKTGRGNGNWIFFHDLIPHEDEDKMIGIATWDLELVAEANLEERLDHIVTLKHANRLLKRMDAKDRRILWERRIDERPNPDIAKSMRMSLPAVKSKFHRASTKFDNNPTIRFLRRAA